MTREPISLWGLAGGGFALMAVVLEMLASVLGDAPDAGYPGWLITITWPTAVRTGWWLVAGLGAAAAASELMPRRSRAARVAVGGLAALPFAVFGLGIAAGASWATWH